MSEKNTEISEESNNKDPESNSTDENRCGVIMPIADTDGSKHNRANTPLYFSQKRKTRDIKDIAGFNMVPATGVVYCVHSLHQLVAVFEWLPGGEHIELGDG